MRTILTYVVLSCAAVFPARAQLPELLDPRILEDIETLVFEGDPRTLISPIGMKLTINDKPALSREALDEAFEDLFYARIPLGARIGVTQNADGRDVWNYPVGAQTFHLVRLRAEGAPIFELRTALLLADGSWDLAIYAPESSSREPTLRRQRYGGMPPLEIQFKSTRSGRDLQIKMNRVPLHNCKMCHFNSSPSRYQFTSSDDAGPCGFGPAHPTLARDWAAEYEKRVGHSPFQR